MITAREVKIFQEILLKICTQETSADLEGWTPENPLWGQCAVVALLANDLWGGTFLRASLRGTPFAFMRSHYWNVLPDGTEYDFTKAQFGSTALHLVGKPKNDSGQEVTREYPMQNPDTERRYLKLSENFQFECLACMSPL